MGATIGYKGMTQVQPNIDISQGNPGQQFVVRFRQSLPINLMPGQVFQIPNGTWACAPGRYTLIQWQDTNAARWRNFTAQPGQPATIDSDGTNYRLANLTGCPIGAVITNVGNGNVPNGYQSITVSASAGNSTWGTLHGGSVNANCNVVAGGNYALPPLLVWSPAANQTVPFVAPMFNLTMSGNAIANVSVVDQGAGLTGVGAITVVQQMGDTNPGGGQVIVAGNNLTNNGNMTDLWVLTPGQNGNIGLGAIPTLTFGSPSSAAATVIMNFCVTGATQVANVGANYGNAQPFMIIAANAIAGTAAVSLGGAGNSNVQVANSVRDYESWPSRNCWLSSNSNAAAQASNANLQIVDAGFGFQAIPFLFGIPANANSAMQNIGNAVFTAVVGGVSDVSFIQQIT